MIVRETEIEISPEHVMNIWIEPARQGRFDSVLGSFEPGSMVFMSIPPRITVDERGLSTVEQLVADLQKGLEGLTSLRQQTLHLIKQTTWPHEMMHFHDSICTSFGIISFARSWHRYFDIYIRLRDLHAKGHLISRPLAMSGLPDGDPDERELLNRLSSVTLEEIIRNGDIEPFEGPAELLDFDIVWGNFAISGQRFRIALFPSTAMIDGVRSCLLLPIGHRAIVEARAVCWQLYHIRSLGTQYVDEYYRIMNGVEYRTINYFATRIFKNNKAGQDIMNYSLDHVFALLSATLTCTDPGPRYDGLVVTMIDEFRRFDVKTGIRAGIELEIISKMEAAERELPEYFYLDASDEFHAYQLRDFALQSFRKALAVYRDNPVQYTFPAGTIEWHLFHHVKLPGPMISSHHSLIGYDLRSELSADDLFMKARAIAASVMYKEIVNQTVWSRDLVCPVIASPHQDFLRSVKQHEFCATGVGAGGCGRFSLGDDITDHCDCPWRIQALAFSLATVQATADAGQA